MKTNKIPGWIYFVVIFGVIGVLGPLFETKTGSYLTVYDGVVISADKTDISSFGSFFILAVIIIIIYFVKKYKK